MGKKEDIQAQIDALQAEMDGADDDTELWVEHPTTKAVGRLKGAHAQSFLDSILGKPEEPADETDETDEKDEKDPAPRSSVWGRK